MALDRILHGNQAPRSFAEAAAEQAARRKGWAHNGAYFVLRDGFGIICNSAAASWSELCATFSIQTRA